MNKIFWIILLIIVLIVTAFAIISFRNNTKVEENSLSNNIIVNNTIENNNEIEEKDMSEIIIKVNGTKLHVELENNSSAVAFANKLKDGDITVNADDYGNFEKVGNLGFSLPTNDTRITTEAGDLILYQGNQITLYYDTNTWSFTKLGKVQEVSKSELKSILGEGQVDMTFSLENE